MDKGANPTIRDMRGALAYEYCDDDDVRKIMGGKFAEVMTAQY